MRPTRAARVAGSLRRVTRVAGSTTGVPYCGGVLGAAVAVPTALIVGREIFVSALREWMATLGCVDRVAVSAWGKLKPATQMVALLVLLVAQPSAAPVAIPKGASAVPHLRAFLARHNWPDSGVRQRFQNRCERKAEDMLDAFGLEYLSDGLTALHDDFSLRMTGACIGECGYHRILP